MATVAEQIGLWLDNSCYPPKTTDLPQSMTLGAELQVAVLDAQKKSVNAKREWGAGLGWWDGKPAKLELGLLEEGDEDSIMVSSRKTPMGSSPMGTFHVHPDASGFHGPSPTDIIALAASSDVIALILAGTVSSPWYYLMVRTADFGTKAEKFLEKKGTFSDLVQQMAFGAIEFAGVEIIKEMSQFTSTPSVDPEIPKQIGYDRTLIKFAGGLGFGFYSGQNGMMSRRG